LAGWAVLAMLSRLVVVRRWAGVDTDEGCRTRQLPGGKAAHHGEAMGQPWRGCLSHCAKHQEVTCYNCHCPGAASLAYTTYLYQLGLLEHNLDSVTKLTMVHLGRP